MITNYDFTYEYTIDFYCRRRPYIHDDIPRVKLTHNNIKNTLQQITIFIYLYIQHIVVIVLYLLYIIFVSLYKFQSLNWFSIIFHSSLLFTFLLIYTHESHPCSFIICWMYCSLDLLLWFLSSMLSFIISFNNTSCRIICPINLFRLLAILFHNSVPVDIYSSISLTVILSSQFLFGILI